MKAATDSDLGRISGENSAPSTPDNSSIAESSVPGDEGSISAHSPLASPEPTEVDTLHSRENTLQASSSSVKSGGSDKNKSEASKDDKEEGSSSSSNLVGKINNLVTTDLENIVDSRDFLLVFLYIPLQITLCIIFLYAVLGWR
jgi:hypothetical protein